MDKEEILMLFMNSKLQLDRESLQYIYDNQPSKEMLSEIMEKVRKDGKLTVALKDIADHKPAERIRIIRTHIPIPPEISVDDVIQDRIRTYDAIRTILQYRLDLVNIISINKINENVKKFSLIAEIVDLDNRSKSATLQDNTGTLNVSLYNLEESKLEQIGKSDILGFLCENDRSVKVMNIVNPDIPLFKDRKKPGKSTGMLFFNNLSKILKKYSTEDIISNLPKKYDRLYIFGFEDPAAKMPSTELPPNTYLATITNSGTKDVIEKVALVSTEGANLLLLHKDTISPKESPANQMTGLLKKRIIAYQKIKDTPVLPFIIDPVPDIFVSNLGGDSQSNYKNTVLLSIGENSEENIFWLIDLESYESLKVKLG